MVQKSSEYATCRWNHWDSSNGSILTFGLIHLNTFLHIGSTMIAPSTDKARPAPRDIHTEKVKVFRPASRWSDTCFHLFDRSVLDIRCRRWMHVPAKSKQADV